MSRVMERWEEALSLRSPSTVTNYRSYFREFLRRTGLTEEGLYELHLRSTRSEDPLDTDVVAGKVKRVMKEMEREGYKGGTVKTIYNSVRLFLRSCNLPFELDRYEMPRVVHEGTNMIMVKQLRRLHDTVGSEMRERNRAMIMLDKDAGLRISDLVALSVEDYLVSELRVDRRKRRFRIFIPKVTEKTGDLSHIIIGEEAIRAVEDYLALEGRTRGPLFLSRIDPIIDETAEETEKARRWHHKRKIVGYEEPERLEAKTASQVFIRLRENLSAPRKISAHSLRKFHYNTLLVSGMPVDYIRFLEGKSYSEYARPIENREEIIAMYMEAYDRLTVLEDGEVTHEAMEEMQKRLEDQQRTIDLMMPTFNIAQKLFAERKEWERLRASPPG